MADFTFKSILLFFLFALLSIKSNGKQKFIVNAERLNVRLTTEVSSKLIGYFNLGDTVEILSTSNPNWYKAIIQDREGYVHSKYLFPVTEPPQITVDHSKDKIVGAVLVSFIIICLIGIFRIDARKKKHYPQDTVIVLKYKSVGAAILLTFLFGPFGMFYSTIRGALIMLSLPVITIIFLLLLASNSTNKDLLGLAVMGSIFFYAIFYWLICIIWAATAASKSNRIIINQNHNASTTYEN